MSLNQELKIKKLFYLVFLELSHQLVQKNIFQIYKFYFSIYKIKEFDDIYCLSVNDKHVMKAWLLIIGHSEITNSELQEANHWNC